MYTLRQFFTISQHFRILLILVRGAFHILKQSIFKP